MIDFKRSVRQEVQKQSGKKEDIKDAFLLSNKIFNWEEVGGISEVKSNIKEMISKIKREIETDMNKIDALLEGF